MRDAMRWQRDFYAYQRYARKRRRRRNGMLVFFLVVMGLILLWSCSALFRSDAPRPLHPTPRPSQAAGI